MGPINLHNTTDARAWAREDAIESRANVARRALDAPEVTDEIVERATTALMEDSGLAPWGPHRPVVVAALSTQEARDGD